MSAAFQMQVHEQPVCQAARRTEVDCARDGTGWRPPPGIQPTKTWRDRLIGPSPLLLLLLLFLLRDQSNRGRARRISIRLNRCQIRRGGARSARKKRGVTGDAFAKQPETLPIPLSDRLTIETIPFGNASRFSRDNGSRFSSPPIPSIFSLLVV